MFKLPSITAPLTQSASRDGLLRNSFRIFGLRSDATSRQIDAALKDLRVHLELGEHGKHAFAPSQFDEGMLAQATQRLRDSVTRFCDECFWFWPMDLGVEDVALELIDNGDKKGAAREWSEFLEHPEWGPVARHNLAVLALHESIENPGALLEFGRYVAEFLSSRACEARVKARLKILDDPRLPRGSADAFIHDWRLAIVRIQVRTALSHAEDGSSSLAGMHGLCAQSVAGEASVMVRVAEGEFEQKLRDLDDRCQQKPDNQSDTDWQNLANDCQRIIERMRTFQGLAGRAALAGNEVARFLMRIALHSHNELKDSQRALRILDAAMNVASGETLEKARKDTDTLKTIIRRNAAMGKLEKLHEKIDSLKNSGCYASSTSIEELLTEVNSVADGHDDKSDLEILYHNFGFLVRGFAVETYNTTENINNAERLLALAQKIAEASEQRGVQQSSLRQKLGEDRAALARNRLASSYSRHSRTSYPSHQGTPSGSSCMVALVALLCLTAAAGYAAPIAAQAVYAWITTQLQ